jgi:hypothetical protein
MEVEEFEGIGGPRALALVMSISLVFAEYPLGGWACERWGIISDEGGGGIALVFFALPLTAGGLGCWSLWQVSRAAAVVSGLCLCATGFIAAAVGC